MLTPMYNSRKPARNFKNVFGISNDDREPYFNYAPKPVSNGLSAIHLSPSLANMENFSPGLWTWVLSPDSRANSVRVFSPSGEQIEKLPAHIAKLKNAQNMNNSASTLFVRGSGGNLDTSVTLMRSATSRSVFKSDRYAEAYLENQSLRYKAWI